MSKSMKFYTVYDINVFVHFLGYIKIDNVYTVYDINVSSTVFPGYVKIDDVIHSL